MEQKKAFVTYADGADKERAVVTVGGREFAVVPMYCPVAVPAQVVKAWDEHGRDGLGHWLSHEGIDRFVEDIRMHLEHCAAFTAIEGEDPDERVRRFSIFLPLLLPLDERDRWCLEMTDEQIKQIEDGQQQRLHTGQPRAFKVVDRKEFEV